MTNVMLKNMLDLCVGMIVWWLMGWGIAYGDGPTIIGTSDYLYAGDDATLIHFIFQFSFAATAATIVSGAVAERMKFISYLTFSGLCTGILYPPVARAVWHGDGLLFGWGFVDYAGCGPVHMVGGVAGMVGAAMIGQRRNKHRAFSSLVYAVMGLLIILWAWLSFNAGSGLAVSGNAHIVAAHVTITTVMSASTGGITGVIVSKIRDRDFIDVRAPVNGLLAGLVGITAGCAFVPIWASAVIGILAALIVLTAEWAIDRFLRIDDPVSAGAVHGCGGMWGLIAVGLFSDRNGVTGLFFGDGGRQLGIQCVGMLVVLAFTVLVAAALFALLKYSPIGMRVTAEQEDVGLDRTEHNIARLGDMRLSNDRIVKVANQRNFVVLPRGQKGNNAVIAYAPSLAQSTIDLLTMDESSRLRRRHNAALDVDESNSDSASGTPTPLAARSSSGHPRASAGLRPGARRQRSSLSEANEPEANDTESEERTAANGLHPNNKPPVPGALSSSDETDDMEAMLQDLDTP